MLGFIMRKVRGARRRIRIELERLLLSNRKGPWIKPLLQAQDIVASTSPHHAYIPRYRPAETGYWRNIPKWIYQDFGDRRADACLDIGCAYGTLMVYSNLVTGCDLYGVDFIDAYMSKDLVAKMNIDYRICNIERQNVPWDKKFDIIILTEILEHFNFKPVPTLCRIRDLLSDGGRLYLSTPDSSEWGITKKYYPSLDDLPAEGPDWVGDVIDDHVWQFDAWELFTTFKNAGLKIVRFDFSSAPGGRRHFNVTAIKA